MPRFILLAVLALNLAGGCRAKGLRAPLGGAAGPEFESSPSKTAADGSDIAMPVPCKENEVIQDGVCMPSPAKCTADQVYLAYLDQCVAATAENMCFSKGLVLADGSCANNAYYGTCIRTSGRTAAQDVLIAKLKVVADDSSCEGSYTKLNQMTSLDVSDIGQPVDLRVIGDFTKLEEFTAEKNLLTSAVGIEKLKDLEKLNLSDNKLTNVTPLAALTDLEDLDLENNKLTDIGPLSTLLRLRDLDLSDNEISSLTSLTSMTNLKKLALDENKNLRDLRPLANLQDLESLSIEDTGVDSLGPLKELFLLELKIEGSSIAGFTSDVLTERNCPIDGATSAVLFDACSLLRGL